MHGNQRQLSIIVSSALAIRLLAGLAFADHLVNPTGEAVQISRSVALGRGFSDPVHDVRTGASAWSSPVYPLIHAGVLRVFGVDSVAAVAAMFLFNSMCSAATCVAIFFVAANLFGHPLAMRAAWAWALFPYAIVQSMPRFGEATLSALLVTLVFLAAWHLAGASSATHWFGFGVVCGLLILTSAAALPVVAVLFAWLMWKSQRRRAEDARLLALAFVAVILAIAPWLLRNYVVFGELVFLRSNLGLELRVGNSENSENFRDMQQHPTGNAREARRMAQLGEIAYMAEKKGQALDFISAHPVRFLAQTLRHVAHFWTGAWDVRLPTLLARPYDTANIVFCTLLTALGLAGLVSLARGQPHTFALWAAILFVYPLIFYITHVNVRYRHPLDPFLIILACVALPWPGKDAPIHSHAA